jgi:peptidoglycan/LPS O-acetylase OafA/YrhL
VEEHYYLLRPLGLLLLAKLNRGRFVGAMVALYVIATAWRQLALQISDPEFVYPRFDTRVSGLILGGLWQFGSNPALLRGFVSGLQMQWGSSP